MSENKEYIRVLANLSKEKEFEFIIDNYIGELRLFAFRYLNDWSIVDDIMQEMMLRAYLNLNTLQEENSIKPWLYKITYNLCIDYLRNNYYKLHLLTDNLETIIQKNSESAEVVVLKKIEKSDLHRIISSLPTIYAEPLKLYYFQQFNYKEISETLNISVGLIKTRLFRARKLIKAIYCASNEF